MNSFIKKFLVFLLLGAIDFFPKTVHANNTAEELEDGIFIIRNIQPETKQKIAIATVIISGEHQETNETYLNITYAKGVDFGTKSKKLYASRHGYNFIIATQKLNTCFGLESERPLECAWTKLALISKILDDYDWVFWSDADSVILNFDTKLEGFLDSDYDIIACSEKIQSPLFKGVPKINTGEVFYKNSDFSKFVIEKAWKNSKEQTPGSFEQKRINDFIQSLSEPEISKILIYPPNAFNSSTEIYQEGDFILHMWAYHGRELYKKFKEVEKNYGWIIKDEESKQNVYQN